MFEIMGKGWNCGGREDSGIGGDATCIGAIDKCGIRLDAFDCHSVHTSFICMLFRPF
jgi:hypothetical protein